MPRRSHTELFEIELTTTAATHATGDVIAISEEIKNLAWKDAHI